ncbi:hypothetical protein LFL96_26780 [Paraburkholderia sp. D15]|uniref:hypothetical protein n=1 Tax=Paraburkholderia sp. D15 TaxID=2880218 RepID=UPI002479325E|nr:hypothetical protein [Paraburkholderia sp. D15]WGS54616.1 hypothetical protein LFL96_26780 [Paraburkholderia sp. D15]
MTDRFRRPSRGMRPSGATLATGIYRIKIRPVFLGASAGSSPKLSDMPLAKGKAAGQRGRVPARYRLSRNIRSLRHDQNGQIMVTPTPQPLSKAQEAFNRLADLLALRDEIDEFTLSRLERMAKEALQVDASNAYQVLGMIASRRWDAAGVNSNFQRAILSAPRAEIHANFGRALCDLNDLEEASVQVGIAADKEPENLLYLRSAINWSFCAGRWTRAQELMRVLLTRTKEQVQQSAELVSMAEMAQRIGLREETVQRTVSCAMEFLQSKKIRVVNYSNSAEKGRGEECIYFAFIVDVDAETARDVDDELTPILFQQVGELQLDSFVFTIEPKVLYESQ